MPLQKLQLRPGVNRESTSYANEGGYYASNKIRFRSGMPEKVGGWTKDTGTNLSALKPPSSFTATGAISGTNLTIGSLTSGTISVGQTISGTGVTSNTTITAGAGSSWTVSISQTVASTTITGSGSTGTIWGVCRALWNWINLSGYNLLALGTNLKYYIQNGTDGFYYDVTPLRNTTTAGEATFAASNGSTTITVTDVGHGAQTGDFVTYSGAVTLGGVITATILNAEFQITYLSSNTYTITSSVAANASDLGNQAGVQAVQRR